MLLAFVERRALRSVRTQQKQFLSLCTETCMAKMMQNPFQGSEIVNTCEHIRTTRIVQYTSSLPSGVIMTHHKIQSREEHSRVGVDSRRGSEVRNMK